MNPEADTLESELHDLLAKHSPGGMVGGFVVSFEAYSEDGRPRLHMVFSDDTPEWLHVGMTKVLYEDALNRVNDPNDPDDGML